MSRPILREVILRSLKTRISDYYEKIPHRVGARISKCSRYPNAYLSVKIGKEAENTHREWQNHVYCSLNVGSGMLHESECTVCTVHLQDLLDATP